MQRIIFKSVFFLCLFAVTLGITTTVVAQNKRILIRDAETESIIRGYATPILRAAGLNPDSVGIHLILNKSLNAFVSGGQNISIHTGLLLETKDVNEVIGVLAHETGHIEGGHLARTSNAVKDASTVGLIGTVIGVGAGILTGRGDVAGAAIVGSQQAAQRSFFQYSQAQESAADQAGLRLLESTGNSARGLYRFLQVLEDLTLLSAARHPPYLRTHPLTRERLEAIEYHMSRSQFTDSPTPAGLQHAHERIRAKLYAYINPFASTMRAYPETDQSIAARYARALAYSKKPDLEKAIQTIDGLLAEYPNDPFFNEMKGDMLFDHGKVKEAVVFYKSAATLAGNSALLYQRLGQAIIAVGDDSLLEEAITSLRKSLTLERQSAFAWHQLAIAYGRMENFGMAALALAEEAFLQRRFPDAIFHAEKARSLLPADPRSTFRRVTL